MIGGTVPILYFITELDVGGAQSALLRLLERLDRGRFSPAVVCLYGGDGVTAHRIRALGIPVTDLGMTARWRPDALWRLYRLLRRERPAILHAWMFHANLLGRVVGRLARVPGIVTSRRNVNIGGNVREALKRYTARLDDRVVAVCEAARQAEVERAGALPERVVTICNGIDAGRFPVAGPRTRARVRLSFGIPDDVPLVLAVGRLHRQKDFATLLTALVRVREGVPAVRLLLVGDGELRPALEAQAGALGLSEIVVFAGFRTDVPAILAAGDLFVLPSLWEGTPNAALEAMAARLPVVATPVGGTPDVVEDGVTGLLVPPANPGELATAITTLLRDPALRGRMGRAGRECVVSQFSLGRMVRRFEGLYEELLRLSERT